MTRLISMNYAIPMVLDCSGTHRLVHFHLVMLLPINDEPGDDLEKFQFTIGKGFR